MIANKDGTYSVDPYGPPGQDRFIDPRGNLIPVDSRGRPTVVYRDSDTATKIPDPDTPEGQPKAGDDPNAKHGPGPAADPATFRRVAPPAVKALAIGEFTRPSDSPIAIEARRVADYLNATAARKRAQQKRGPLIDAPGRFAIPGSVSFAGPVAR